MFMTTIRGTTYTANTLAGLSAAYCLARDESGEGASTFPFAGVYVMDRGAEKTIGHFSYNGRIWPNVDFQEGVSPLYDPAADPVRDAAPAMLEALQQVLDDWPNWEDGEPVNGGDMVEWFGTWRETVKAAVAKAEGRANG